MIIYNKSWLANLIIQNQINAAHRSGEILPEEMKQVETAYPVGFYSPNISIRIGLFLLTCLIVGFSCGLFTLLFLNGRQGQPELWMLFFGVVTYIILESMVRSKHHFRSGVDDALIWISGGLIFSSFFLMIQDAFNADHRIISIAISLTLLIFISFYLTIRFADRLMAVVSLASIFILAAILWYQTGTIGRSTLPFLLILLAALSYFITWSNRDNPQLIYYRHCLQFLQGISLLVFYLAGNYYMVQRLGNWLSEYNSFIPYQVPMPYFFWAWTVLIPLVYIGFGIRIKNVILLRSGLILIAGAALTFRNYYHVMPIEGTLVLVGVVILGISYSIIRYLKVPKNGFTYEDLNEDHLLDNVKIESLIISTMDTGSPSATENKFGGGSFGGGGSSGDF